MSLVGNERAKLTASYVNGLAIAIVGVGGFAPVVSVATTGNVQHLWVTAILMLTCAVISVTLHLVARRILGGMTE